MYANLLGIPCFVENSAWGIENEKLHSARGIWIVFHRGLRFGILDSVGEESFIFTGDLEFRDLTLMGILKLNSVRDMYFKVLAF